MHHYVHAPGYSDFFASGIRLVSRRIALESPAKPTSSPKPIPLSFDGALSSESDSELENEPESTSTTKMKTESRSKKATPTSRRLSMLNPLTAAKLTSSFSTSSSSTSSSAVSANTRIHGTAPPKPKSKKHHQRSASDFMVNFFGSRKSRYSAPPQTMSASVSACCSTRMSNDESGWLSSSASSVRSFAPNEEDEDDVDFMDFSVWPECPNDGRLLSDSYHPRAVSTEIPIPVSTTRRRRSEELTSTEILDPFSSSPSSKSFFVDVSLRGSSPTTAAAATSPTDGRKVNVPIRRNNRPAVSTQNPWARSNRWSFSSLSSVATTCTSSSSSSSSSFFTSSRRKSASFLSFGSPITPSSDRPSTDASFLHLPKMSAVTRRRSGMAGGGKRSSVVEGTKRPASICVMPTTSINSSSTSVHSPPQLATVPLVATSNTTTSCPTTTPTATIPPVVATPLNIRIQQAQRRRHSAQPTSSSSSSFSRGSGLPLTQSDHTRSRSLPLSPNQTPIYRSRPPVRSSWFWRPNSKKLETSHSISVEAIPESESDGDCDNEHPGNSPADTYGIPSLNSTGIPDPDLEVSASGSVDHAVIVGGSGGNQVRTAGQSSGLRLLIGDDEEAPDVSSEMDDDVTKRVDWREFCIEVLDGHSDA